MDEAICTAGNGRQSSCVQPRKVADEKAAYTQRDIMQLDAIFRDSRSATWVIHKNTVTNEKGRKQDEVYCSTPFT